jgi:hypothetical protein
MDTRLKRIEVMGAQFHMYGFQNWVLDRTGKKKTEGELLLTALK